jgi:hypothetical protein
MKNKITTGFVIQTFTDDGEFIRQEFIAGDDVQWEDKDGNPIDDEDFYMPYAMLNSDE